MNEIKLNSEGKNYFVTDINNNNKYSRAKTDAGLDATQEQILAHYDKLGGYIHDEAGNKVKHGSFWKNENINMAKKRKQGERWLLIKKIYSYCNRIYS